MQKDTCAALEPAYVSHISARRVTEPLQKRSSVTPSLRQVVTSAASAALRSPPQVSSQRRKRDDDERTDA